mgnify:CR=1 FL=1
METGTILIVDDNKSVLASLELLLENVFSTVRTAANPNQITTILSTTPIDIVILDIEMPGMNGMEAAEKIRQADEDVVLMFITNMIQYAIRGYSVGALDFVMKPVNYYTFSLKLTRAIGRIQKIEKEFYHFFCDYVVETIKLFSSRFNSCKACWCRRFFTCIH